MHANWCVICAHSLHGQTQAINEALEGQQLMWQPQKPDAQPHATQHHPDGHTARADGPAEGLKHAFNVVDGHICLSLVVK